ncbi:MAG TPA: hypothetical protein VGB82_04130 [Alphaproteobacteria bacterium]
MTELNIVYVLLAIPLAAAAILIALPWHRVSAILNAMASLATFGVSISLLRYRPEVRSFVFIDDLNVALVVLTSFVAFTTSWFSASYITHEEPLAAASLAALDITTVAHPIPFPKLAIKQFWHERYHDDPANRWLRQTCTALFQTASHPVRFTHTLR